MKLSKESTNVGILSMSSLQRNWKYRTAFKINSQYFPDNEPTGNSSISLLAIPKLNASNLAVKNWHPAHHRFRSSPDSPPSSGLVVLTSLLITDITHVCKKDLSLHLFCTQSNASLTPTMVAKQLNEKLPSSQAHKKVTEMLRKSAILCYRNALSVLAKKDFFVPCECSAYSNLL